MYVRVCMKLQFYKRSMHKKKLAHDKNCFFLNENHSISHQRIKFFRKRAI